MRRCWALGFGERGLAEKEGGEEEEEDEEEEDEEEEEGLVEDEATLTVGCLLVEGSESMVEIG